MTGLEQTPAEQDTVTVTLERWTMQELVMYLENLAAKTTNDKIWWEQCCADKRMGAAKAAKLAVSVERIKKAIADIEKELYKEKET